MSLSCPFKGKERGVTPWTVSAADLCQHDKDPRGALRVLSYFMIAVQRMHVNEDHSKSSNANDVTARLTKMEDQMKNDYFSRKFSYVLHPMAVKQFVGYERDADLRLSLCNRMTVSFGTGTYNLSFLGHTHLTRDWI